MATSTSQADDVAGGIEASMYELIQADPYFQSLPQQVAKHAIKTLGSLRKVRTVADFQPTVERVEDEFSKHNEAIGMMTKVAKSLVTAASEWRANLKALKKARFMEQKHEEREAERAAKAAARAEERQRKKEEQHRLHVLANQADQEGEPQQAQDKKKRRMAGRIQSELCDSDPPVLRSRFGEFTIPVTEKIVALMQSMHCCTAQAMQCVS